MLDLVDDIIDRGARGRPAPVAGVKTFESLQTFFNWCMTRDIISASPCAGIDKRKRFPVAKARDRVLTDDEIRWFWKACGAEGYPFGPLLRLLLVTGTRREEVRAMTDHELRLADRTWSIPAARTKNGHPHDVTLTELALTEIEALKRVKNDQSYLFCTNGKTPVDGFSKAKTRIDEAMLELARQEATERGDDPETVRIAPWVIHDLRRTFATGLARLGTAIHVTERCLNHVSGASGGLVRVYQRFEYAEEKRRAFEAWSRFLVSIISEESGQNVVLLRTAAE